VLSLWVGSPWVEAWVDEKYLCRIRAGGTADVTLPAFPGQKLRGTIESIGVLADKELQTAPVPSALQSFLAPDSKVRVCITVPADHLRVQPGLSAMVGIDGSPNDVAASAARRIDAAFATVAGTFSGKGKAEKH
jgi:multidrug resistance efflux pump